MPHRKSFKPLLILSGIVLLQLLIHLPMLHLPPSGQHTWRQVVGYAAARAYHVEDAKFWEPRADIRLSQDDSGKAYHELPLVYWLVAKSYDLFGENYYSARLIPLLLNLVLVFAAFYFMQGMGYAKDRSLWFAFLITSSPLYIYYSATLVPNMMGLTVYVSGLALILSPLREGRLSPRLVCGFALLGLATLVKPTYLFYGLPIVYLILTLPPKAARSQVLALAVTMGGIILAVNAAVIQNARQIHAASPPARAIHTPVGPAESPESLAQILDNLQRGFFTWFIEMQVNLAALPFFLVGLWLAYRHRSWKTWQGGFWAMWLISLSAYLSLFVVRIRDHDYYINSALPLAAMVSSAGMVYLLKSPRWRLLFVILILIVGVNRAQSRWFKRPEIPRQFLAEPEAIVADIPPQDLILVSGDSSPIVFLYFLNRRGLALPRSATAASVKSLDLEDFRWLVHYEGAGALGEDFIQDLGLIRHSETGDFTVYQLPDLALP